MPTIDASITHTFPPVALALMLVLTAIRARWISF